MFRTKVFAEPSAKSAKETLSKGRGGTAKVKGRAAEERAALEMMTPNQLRQSGNRYNRLTQQAGNTGR